MNMIDALSIPPLSEVTLSVSRKKNNVLQEIFRSVQHSDRESRSGKLPLVKSIPEFSSEDKRELRQGFIAFVILGLFIGTIALLHLSNRYAVIDHVNDTVYTKYKCDRWIGGHSCEEQMRMGYLTNESFYVDHTADRWVPETKWSVGAMCFITILPPLMVITAWKLWTGTSHFRMNIRNRKILNHNTAITRAECARILPSKPAAIDLNFQRHEENLILKFDDGQSLRTSKSLLTKNSSVFKTMFGKFKEGDSNDPIPLNEIDRKAFEAALIYYRTGKLLVEGINGIFLVKIADQYDFFDLKSAVETRLCEESDILLKQHGVSFLLEFCDFYRLNNLLQTLDLKLGDSSAEGNYLFELEDYMNRLREALKYNLKSTLETLCRKFLHELDDKQVISLLLKMGNTDKASFLEFFAAARFKFDKDPAILKALWEQAIYVNETVEDAIVEFCQNPSNAHIYLKNWKLPAKKPLKII